MTNNVSCEAIEIPVDFTVAQVWVLGQMHDFLEYGDTSGAHMQIRLRLQASLLTYFLFTCVKKVITVCTSVKPGQNSSIIKC